MKIKKIFPKIILFIVFSLLLGFVLAQTSLAFYHRVGSFGCAGQCLHIVAGKFMVDGKTLYSDIFYNHQPLMAEISFLIQKHFQPASLYQLILFHRLFIIGFSLAMDAWLILRFRYPGAVFVLFYEATKFYLFGNSFLPEALVVYPLVYLFGLAWLKIKNQKIKKVDHFLAVLSGWGIFFTSWSSIAVGFLLLAMILFYAPHSNKIKLIFLIVLILPLVVAINYFPAKEYFFNLLEVNKKIFLDEARGTGTLGLGAIKSFFYPLFILVEGESNFFRLILVGLDLAFLTATGLMITRLKKYKEILFFLTILGISLNRFVTPGKIYYESYYLLPWFGLFLFSISLMLRDLLRHSRPVLITLALVFTFLVSSPSWFVNEKVDIQKEFSTNYTHYYVLGETIKELSSPDDRLFIDQWDELIFWQAQRRSAYPYSVYTPIMSSFSLFTEARLKMFKDNPPEYYYSFCTKEILQSNLLPEAVKKDYFQLSANGEPTCLFILKSKMVSISAKQWDKVRSLGFEKTSPSAQPAKAPAIFLF